LALGASFIGFGFWLNATCTTTATTSFGSQCIQRGWGLAGDIANSIAVLGIGLVLVGFITWGLGTLRAERMQTVVAPSEVDQFLADGWHFVTTLPDGRVVVEKPQ
jgi:hypothetical protein